MKNLIRILSCFFSSEITILFSIYIKDIIKDHAFAEYRFCILDKIIKHFFKITYSSNHIEFVKIFKVVFK